MSHYDEEMGLPRRRRRLGPPQQLDDHGPPQDPVEPPDDDATLPVVIWWPIRCPHCGSKDKTTYGQTGRLRYHRCNEHVCRREHDWDQRYKSIERGGTLPAETVAGRLLDRLLAMGDRRQQLDFLLSALASGL